jgi:hypothetical protein
MREVVIALLGLAILAQVASIVIDLRALSLVHNVIHGGPVTFSQLHDTDQRIRMANGGGAVVVLIGGCAFIPWFYRAYRNLARIGYSDLRFRTGWAIGGWLVPIANLIRPKEIANDIWRATSSDGGHPGPTGWKARPVSRLVHWWWTLFVLGNFAGNIASRLYLSSRTPQAAQSALEADVIASVVTIVAGVLAILFVRAITEREDRMMVELYLGTDWRGEALAAA